MKRPLRCMLLGVVLAPMGVSAQQRTPSRLIGPPADALAPASAPARPMPQPSKARPWIPTVSLKGGSEVVGLCDTLRAEEGLTFPGNEVERARAREEHRRRRTDAAGRNYVIDVPPDGYSFREYDLTDRQLTLETDRSFTVSDGVELYSADRDSVLDFELPPEVAEAVVKERARKSLALRLLFRGVQSEVTQDPCLRLGGGRIAKMRVEVLAYDLIRKDGVTLARGETADFQEAAISATPVTTPQVVVRRPSSDTGEVSDELAVSAQALGASLLPCYLKALQARPGLRGTVVVGAKLAPDGHLEAPKMEVSSIGDDGVVACVVARVAKARFGKVSSAMKLSIPIAFGGRDDR